MTEVNKELMKDLSLNFRVDRLDVAGLAQANGYLKGQNSLLKYERLSQESCRLEVDLTDEAVVSWQANGELVENAGEHAKVNAQIKAQVWLHLKAQAHLPQTCQRCLGEVTTFLEVERSYRFVADEATAEAEDDEYDEDLLAISREFNLLELIEDELLMALPQVPMHDICPVQPKMAAVDEDFEAEGHEGKPNPFAILAALKGKK
jgi:uncharacterized protein